MTCPDMVLAEAKKSLKRKKSARLRALKKRSERYGMFAEQFVSDQLVKNPSYYNPIINDDILLRAEARVEAKLKNVKWDMLYIEKLEKDERNDYEHWFKAVFLRDVVKRKTTWLEFEQMQSFIDRSTNGTLYMYEFWHNFFLNTRAKESLNKPAIDFQEFLKRWVWANNRPTITKREELEYLVVAEFIEKFPKKRITDIRYMIMAQRVRQVRQAWCKLGYTDCNIRESLLDKPVKSHSKQSKQLSFAF